MDQLDAPHQVAVNCDDTELDTDQRELFDTDNEYGFEKDLIYGRSDYHFQDEDDDEDTANDNPNEPPILKAAEKGYLQLVEDLLRSDPGAVNISDIDGYTALHRACYSNRIEVVKCLIENGANLFAKTVDGWQPIHSAAQWGNVDIVKILVGSGADINARSNGGNTPFHLAASRSTNRPLIEYMLFSDEVDIEAKNDAKDTAFDICKRNSRLYKLWELL